MVPLVTRLIALLLLSTLLGLAGPALADGGKKVAVKPLAPRAGDTVTVVGGGLGANRDVEIRLVAPGLGVDLVLGEIRSLDDGDFEGELALPADLRPGTYQLKATGDATEATQITLLAAAGAGATTSGSGVAPGAAAEIEANAPLPTRPFGETALLVAIFGGLAGLGLFVARTAPLLDNGAPTYADH